MRQLNFTAPCQNKHTEKERNDADDMMQVSYLHAIFLQTVCDLHEKLQSKHMQADLQQNGNQPAASLYAFKEHVF